MASLIETVCQRYVDGQYFDKVLITGVFDVKLTHTTEQVGVEVEALREGHAFVNIEVRIDHTLSIRLLNNYSLPSKIIIHIKFNVLKSYTTTHLVGSTKSVNEINQNEKFVLRCSEGSENVDLQLRVPDFDAFLGGTSENIFSGNVTNEAHIKCDGVVDVDASALVTSKMNVETNGVGQVTIQANDEINAHVDGVSKVYYRGPLRTVRQNGMAQILPY